MHADGLFWLFLSAFVSSTLMPGGSEAVLAALLWRGDHTPFALLLVATAGNTLGGMSSWALGRLLAWRWPLRELARPAQRRAVERLRRRGPAVLLLSWLPVIGDPLCLAAGWLKVGGGAALVFIALGKAARYAVLVYVFG